MAHESDAEELPWPYNTLSRIELDAASHNSPFDIIPWFARDKKLYACISSESEAFFIESESRRGQCTLVRHAPNRPDKKCLKNVTYLCSHSKERRAERKVRQQLGHAAAAQVVQDRSKCKEQADVGDASSVVIKRVGKNSTGEAVTCAKCQYRLQLKEFRKQPGCLFLVLTASSHTNSAGVIAHGQHSDQLVVRKSAPTELRQFILTQHQAGVPAARIIQGMTNSMLAFETWLMATVQFK
jgi:hypothetical protein